MYALTLAHKHIPEMTQRGGLTKPVLFVPTVADFYQGMVVAIPLPRRLMAKSMDAHTVRDLLAEYYQNEQFIRVMPYDEPANLDQGFMDAQGCNHTNRMDLFVFGNEENLLLLSRLDNLGKGASGAAVQCMNIALGLDEGAGLNVE